VIDHRATVVADDQVPVDGEADEIACRQHAGERIEVAATSTRRSMGKRPCIPATGVRGRPPLAAASPAAYADGLLTLWR
jgi:hypothetical protein